MSTYNAYFNKNVQVGNETPVWLGVVSPIPVGAVLHSDYAYAGAFSPAGTFSNSLEHTFRAHGDCSSFSMVLKRKKA